jgi:hypothetical protein
VGVLVPRGGSLTGPANDCTLPRLSAQLHAWARGWILLALLVALVGFAVLTLPGAEAASGGRALDAMLFYAPDEAFSILASYGDAGRVWIRTYYLTVDIVNPILYSLLFGLLLSWLFQRGFKPASRMQTLNVLPVGAAVFDLLENACIVGMLSVYPAQPRIVAWLATGCTMIKGCFLCLSLLLVLVGLVRVAMNRFRKQ